MDHLPSIPKDWEKINRLSSNLSRSDLELLNNMDDESRRYFFDSIPQEIESRGVSSSIERGRAMKLFFTVAGICALVAVVLLNKPNSELSALIWIFSSLAFVSIIGNFIAIPIKAIKSAIRKTEFSLKENLLLKDPYWEGLYLFTLFVLALNDLF